MNHCQYYISSILEPPIPVFFVQELLLGVLLGVPIVLLMVFIGVLASDALSTDRLRDAFMLSLIFLSQRVCEPQVTGASIFRALLRSASKLKCDITARPKTHRKQEQKLHTLHSSSSHRFYRYRFYNYPNINAFVKDVMSNRCIGRSSI